MAPSRLADPIERKWEALMVKRAFVGLFAVPFALSLSGCFMFAGMKRTPMQPQAVQSLTTCGTGDMAAVKKNLMLAGYGIVRADDETIETDYKQTSSGYGGKEFLKVTAVRVDDKTVKFKVRVRSESQKTVQTGELKDSNGRTIATDSQVVNDQNEADEAYYQEFKQQYEQTHQDVCGTGSSAT
jgi:hypothetical protein